MHSIAQAQPKLPRNDLQPAFGGNLPLQSYQPKAAAPQNQPADLRFLQATPSDQQPFLAEASAANKYFPTQPTPLKDYTPQPQASKSPQEEFDLLLLELTDAKRTIADLRKEVARRDNVVHLNIMLESQVRSFQEKDHLNKKHLLETQEKLKAVIAENEDLQTKLYILQTSNKPQSEDVLDTLKKKLKTYKEILGNLEIFKEEYIKVDPPSAGKRREQAALRTHQGPQKQHHGPVSERLRPQDPDRDGQSH